MLEGRRRAFRFPLTTSLLTVLTCLALFQIARASRSSSKDPLRVDRWQVAYTAADGRPVDQSIAAPKGWLFFETAPKGALRLEIELPSCTRLSGYRFLAGPYKEDIERLPGRWSVSALGGDGAWTVVANERRGIPYQRARWYTFPLNGPACVAALRFDITAPRSGPILRLFDLQPIAALSQQPS